MTSVFISHSYKDKEFVRKIASDLAAKGIRPWVDEAEIKVGDSLIKKIEEGLRQSDYILIVLSKNSINSAWVTRELRRALKITAVGGKPVILPVLINNIEIPEPLKQIKYVDLTQNESYQAGINEIIRVVTEATVSESQKPSNVINVESLAKEVAKEVSQILVASPNGIRQENHRIENIDTNLVFVIIAFNDDMEPVFEGIRDAGKAHGLRVERTKDILGDYKIADKILELILKARLVVADLTYERPNVYFELGYARGIGKTVITTAREGTNLHFDVKDWTCTFYNDSRVLEKHLMKRFAYELGIT